MSKNYKLEHAKMPPAARGSFEKPLLDPTKLFIKGNDQALNQLIMNFKGSHGLHRGTFKLQTMTALIKSFCRGVQGGQFLQKAPPLAAGGKNSLF